MIWSLIVGALTSRNSSMGWIVTTIAGLVGSFVGQALLGTWGPSLVGMALIPSVIGAVIVILIASFIIRVLNNKK